MLSLLPLVLSLATPAHAQDCDAKVLTKSMVDASPVQVADLFVKLAACDPAAARKVAPEQLLRVLPGADGDKAAVAAVQVGATDALKKWMDTMISGDRSRTIAALGTVCNSVPEVKTYLLATKEQLGEQFWTERWYRSLADCGGDDVGAILAAALDKGSGADKTRYFGILETYARSQGVKALPKLVELEARFTDVETQTYVIQAFPDVAQVGSEGGMDIKAAQAASQAIQGLAPTLGPKVVEAARVALQSLGDEAAADALAGERFREVRQDDGHLIWGVVLVESASCKKGTQTWRRVHTAMVDEHGQTWPDQLQDKVQTSVETGWELSLGAKCKTEESLSWNLPSEPFADTAAYKTWRDGIIGGLDSSEVAKSWQLDHDPLSL